MEDEEDDVFEPDPSCWRTPFREIKCEDRGTQTPSPGLAPHNGMLPCGVVEEPRPLFYGNAGFRLHFPAHFELVRDFDARRPEEQNRMEHLPLDQPAALSLEACIGQKLQLIGDQFHREHLQQVPPAGDCRGLQVSLVGSSAGEHKRNGLPVLRCLSALPSVV
ncbi:bcl-2-modifying factor-like isoform X3 [Girardinichthys multiradiatus]|uniref:bcl-2-modifying factor-like isoform X3 n=1 Tax=Girardinichthys multiradiatus TaxID=208333 RepID=UPI001FAD453E|nr:bcl-2-modifying factor-like isoform X3 [Girardinichthys multiradiatus]